jgi:hypothetical protein
MKYQAISEPYLKKKPDSFTLNQAHFVYFTQLLHIRNCCSLALLLNPFCTSDDTSLAQEHQGVKPGG